MRTSLAEASHENARRSFIFNQFTLNRIPGKKRRVFSGNILPTAAVSLSRRHSPPFRMKDRILSPFRAHFSPASYNGIASIGYLPSGNTDGASHRVRLSKSPSLHDYLMHILLSLNLASYSINLDFKKRESI